MLTTVERWIATRLSSPIWSANVGLARTFLAICGLGTLLASSVATLIRPASGVNAMFCQGPAGISTWCLSPTDAHEFVRWASIAILAVSASGWRPRITAIPLWWILFSNQASLTVVDGGDQIAGVLALLLIPVSLMDPRVWHWRAASPTEAARHPHAGVTAAVTLVVIQVQVAYIYINACLAKLGVAEWLDGSSVYYWMRDPMFGPAGPLRAVADAAFAQSVPVAVVTWGTLLLEFTLGISLFLPKRIRKFLLPAGVALHLGIAISMGLWSFAFAMWAALLLLLWPTGDAIGFARNGLRFFRSRRLGRSKDITASDLPMMK